MVLAAVLSACKVGPNFKPPQEPVPDQYAGIKALPPSPASQPASDAAAPAPGAHPSSDTAAPPPGPQPASDSRAPSPGPKPTSDATAPSFWWREFHDPELDDLIDSARRGNLDLKGAYLRIVEARIQVQSARAQGLPHLGASAAYTREQLGLAGILKSKGIDTATGPASASAAQGLISSLEQPVNLYQLGFDASWEIDLFGKVRRSVEAANAQSAAALESRNDLLVSLEAEVAQTYFQLRASQTLRQIALDEIAAQREIADLTQNRREHGLAGEPDVDAARAQLASLQAQLPPYEQTIAASRHALAVLIGQTPESLDTRFADQGALPALPASVPVGVPAVLARRRPDIRNSEAMLHAATAEIGVSVAGLFPDVSLAGTYGLRNLGTRYLFDWSSHFYTFGPSVSLPIFEGGALIASVRLSRAQAAEAALSYRKTVLGALQEVEDGLSALDEDAQRIAALERTVGADERAVEVQLDAYSHGVISYITVLTLQLQTIQAREQLAEAMLTQSTDLVKLYKALGGGWEDA
jgi:NodT family efflux transporter outer membrane factor (OMF) lipoprotein